MTAAFHNFLKAMEERNNVWDLGEFIREYLAAGNETGIDFELKDIADIKAVRNWVRFEQKGNFIAILDNVAEESDLRTNEVKTSTAVVVAVANPSGRDSGRKEGRRIIHALFVSMMKALKGAASEMAASGFRLPQKVGLKPIPVPWHKRFVCAEMRLNLEEEADFGEVDEDYWGDGGDGCCGGSGGNGSSASGGGGEGCDCDDIEAIDDDDMAGIFG